MGNPKLEIPRPARSAVLGGRCLKLLKNEAGRPLTTVVAPIGYGKTTLLGMRAASPAGRGTVGWLTLDTDDNDVRRLLGLLIEMLPPANEEARLELLLSLQSESKLDPMPAPSETLEKLLRALNELEEVCLFFDRYEAIVNEDAHRLFETLISRSGRRVRYFFASRERLPFAANLRHLHPLTVTHEHLRLTPEETGEYVRRSLARRLEDEELERLDRLAEGWPLALDAFVSSSAEGTLLFPRRSSDKGLDELPFRLNDVFLDNVLNRQPERLRRFLLRTSVPDSFDAELCRLLTEDEASSELLQQGIDRGLFLFRDTRGRCRYHPLFRSWLHARFRESEKEKYAQVRERAIRWLERNGNIFEAIRLALLIPDYDRAEALLLADIGTTFSAPKPDVLDILQRFPDAETTGRPSVAMLYAWFLAAEHRISAAERALDGAEARMEEGPFVFPPTGEDLRGYFASIRSRIAYLRRDSERGMALMKRTEELLGGPGLLYSQYNTIDPCGSSLLNSDAGHWGAIDQTVAMCEYAEPLWNGENQGYGIIQILLGECRYERNELDSAESGLQKGRRIGLDLMDTGLILPASLTLVSLRWARGERQAARVMLQETTAMIAGRIGAAGRETLAACDARLLIRENRAEDVNAWLRERSGEPRGPGGFGHLYRELTKLRAFVFLGHFRQGVDFGERLLHLCESWYLRAHAAEAALLLSVLYERSGDAATAFRRLETALDIGRGEGYVRLFLDEWELAETLVRMYVKRRSSKEPYSSPPRAAYCKLLAQAADERRFASDSLRSARRQLTAKEYEVLQTLIEGRSNPAIADALNIRLETVKTHCRSIYKKLGVNGRKEAAAKFRP
ncbi:LuxR C-terminal-related transcriptional regulator [Cohnella cellulosilytica]|uniref:LuxR C-terminal-related transcriptional regulator n=1 Tax=Cohnella cellulosilytica TaxID=986710 RepID=A0ABW2F1V6_9BACL